MPAACDVHTIASSPSNSDQTLNGSPRRHSSVDEIFGLVNSMNINGQRQRSLSDSGRKDRNVNGENYHSISTKKNSQINATVVQVRTNKTLTAK